MMTEKTLKNVRISLYLFWDFFGRKITIVSDMNLGVFCLANAVANFVSQTVSNVKCFRFIRVVRSPVL